MTALLSENNGNKNPVKFSPGLYILLKQSAYRLTLTNPVTFKSAFTDFT